ncbi:DUF7931 domain-containing protein [Alkalimarinus alittae]|uniref:DUF7931 domain-containing protein n=1 Tax=Alkalimarinus alittae TaxID=2961619 RepID=A0ABY6N732_9ALTE|nr:hypothetical protein [Alkalimarinus alittae]UZE97928.1 hypothetical protein NKI27_09405 [Alkalimarinus alittae]
MNDNATNNSFTEDIPSSIENQHTYSLGEDKSTHLFSSPDSLRALTTSMISQATNKVRILSHHLNREIYDYEPIRDAISKLARAHSRSTIELLIVDEHPLVVSTQRLLELVRRLPSSIQLRVINKSYPYDESAMVLVDRCGVIFQKENSIYEGFANFNSAGRNKQLTEVFDHLWRHSSESQELRQLRL